MARAAIHARQSSTIASVVAPVNHWHWLTRVALLLTLALVLCRGMMTDSIRAGLPDVQPGTEASPLAPGPGTSLALDLLCTLPALLVLTRRVIDPTFVLVRSWVFWPMLLLAALAGLSPLWADDRFAAVVSACHFASALVLLWSTAQIVRSGPRLRLVAATAVALLLVLVISGYVYRLVDFRDLQTEWQTRRAEILKERNLQPGSFEAQQFEKRIVAGQPMGFSTSTNSYAALLVLLGVISAGVVIQRIANRDGMAWMIVPACAAVATLPLIRWTLCRAAYVTPVLSAMLLLGIYLLRPWLRRLARPLFVVTVLLIAGATAGVVRHGIRHGTLWHDSLNFRWTYWVGSYRVLTQDLPMHRFEQFLIGVGWENFGPHYLAHRLPVAAEEIRDPHNFIIRAFVELGMIGGTLLLIWMLKLWWDLTRPSLPAPDEPSTTPIRGGRSAFVAIASIAVLSILVNALLSIDYTLPAGAKDQDARTAFMILELARRGIYLIAIFIALAVVVLRRIERPSTEADAREVSLAMDERPAPWLLYAILVGLGTFLVHNLIEFSFYETGPMYLFALLAGSALGIRLTTGLAIDPARSRGRRRIGSVAALSLGGAAWVAMAAVVFVPIATAEGLAHDADDAARARQPAEAASLMGQAFARVPYNSDYAQRQAIDLIRAGADAPAIRAALDRAVAADPSSVSNLVQRAQFEMSAQGRDPDGALRDLRAALTLDPRNVRLRIQYADALERYAGEFHRPQLSSESLLQYERALDMNDQYHWDEPKRLSRQEIEAVRKHLAKNP